MHNGPRLRTIAVEPIAMPVNAPATAKTDWPRQASADSAIGGNTKGIAAGVLSTCAQSAIPEFRQTKNSECLDGLHFALHTSPGI